MPDCLPVLDRGHSRVQDLPRGCRGSRCGAWSVVEGGTTWSPPAGVRQVEEGNDMNDKTDNNVDEIYIVDTYINQL